jgi:hypothetical protein
MMDPALSKAEKKERLRIAVDRHVLLFKDAMAGKGCVVLICGCRAQGTTALFIDIVYLFTSWVQD